MFAELTSRREDGVLTRLGGPRSLWGARRARAIHRAVLAGANGWTP